MLTSVVLPQPLGPTSASNVKSINLQPSDEANFSNIFGDNANQYSIVTGNIEGDVVTQRESGGQGGVCRMEIGGDIEGDMTLDATTPALDINGSVTATGWSCERLRSWVCVCEHRLVRPDS